MVKKEKLTIGRQGYFKCDKLTTCNRPDILHLIFLDMNRLCLRVAFPLSGSARLERYHSSRPIPP